MSDAISSINDTHTVAELADKSQQAVRAQKQFIRRLKSLVHTETSSDSLPKHLLQLRHDQIDIVLALIHLNKAYCKALGISSLNSRMNNLERVLYALGFDSLNSELK